jgi:poly(A) polymerase
VSPSFLFATLLWHEVLQAWETRKAKGGKPVPALHEAMDEVLDRQSAQLSIPKRFAGVMKEIWVLQPRFEQRSGQRPFRLLETERFRAAFDFLGLRCKSGEVPVELADWWQTFQDADGERRVDMLKSDEGKAGGGRRRRRPRKRRNGEGTAPATVPAADSSSAAAAE